MQKIILYTIVIVFSLLSKVIAQETKLIEPSTEWEQHGSASDSYQMGIDNDINAEREIFFTIKSIKKRIKGFGGLSKTINPNQYLGKTIKMSGYLKSENVKSWAGLWMRVDELKSLLAFDNMYSRPIKNTTDWTRYEIVLYIPVEASSISYGVLLDGTGQIWFKDIIIEIVDDSTIETGIVKGRSPKNFTFESKAKAISNQIEMITTEEKKALKVEVEAIDLQVKDGKITYEKAQELKQKIAEERARNIENKLAIEEVVDNNKRTITFSPILRERLGHHIYGDIWATTIKDVLLKNDLIEISFSRNSLKKEILENLETLNIKSNTAVTIDGINLSTNVKINSNADLTLNQELNVKTVFTGSDTASAE